MGVNMKTLLLSFVAVAVATTAIAQPTSPTREDRDSYDSRDRYEERRGYNQRDSYDRRESREGRRSYDGDITGRDDGHKMSRHDRDMSPHHMHDGRMFRAHHPWMFGHGDAAAARFRFQRGDSRIDVRCADHESTSVCVDSAIRLMEKVMTMRPGEGTGTRPLTPDSSPRP
jgi:Ni/Co efflux regulator RcnB